MHIGINIWHELGKPLWLPNVEPEISSAKSYFLVQNSRSMLARLIAQRHAMTQDVITITARSITAVAPLPISIIGNRNVDGLAACIRRIFQRSR